MATTAAATNGGVIEYFRRNFEDCEDDGEISVLNNLEGLLALESESHSVYTSKRCALVDSLPSIIRGCEEATSVHLHELNIIDKEAASTDADLRGKLGDSAAACSSLSRLVQEVLVLDREKKYVEIVGRVETLSEKTLKLATSSSPLQGLPDFTELMRLRDTIDGSATGLREMADTRIKTLALTFRKSLFSSFRGSLTALGWPRVNHAPLNTEKRALETFLQHFDMLLNLQLDLAKYTKIDLSARPRSVASSAGGADSGASGAARPKLQDIGKLSGPPLWVLQLLMEPILVRFRYHFEGERDTNRLDRLGWMLSHVATVIKDHSSFVEGVVGEALERRAETRALDPMAAFVLPLLRRVCLKLRQSMPTLLQNQELLSKAVDDVLAFEKSLRTELLPVVGCGSAWPSPLRVFTQPEPLAKWVQVELSNAEARLDAALDSERAWTCLYPRAGDTHTRKQASGESAGAVEWGQRDEETPQVTECAEAVVVLVDSVMERFVQIPELEHQQMFVHSIQKPLLQRFYSAVYTMAKACDVLYSPRHKIDWRRYCAGVSSCEYVRAVVEEWETDVSKVYLSVAALEAQQRSAALKLRRAELASGAKLGQGQRLGALGSSLGIKQLSSVKQSVTSGVRSAVATGSSAVTSALRSQEAEAVTRAFAGPMAMIGPTKALSAAFSSLSVLGGSVGVKTVSSAVAHTAAAAAGAVGLRQQQQGEATTSVSGSPAQKPEQPEPAAADLSGGGAAASASPQVGGGGDVDGDGDGAASSHRRTSALDVIGGGDAGAAEEVVGQAVGVGGVDLSESSLEQEGGEDEDVCGVFEEETKCFGSLMDAMLHDAAEAASVHFMAVAQTYATKRWSAQGEDEQEQGGVTAGDDADVSSPELQVSHELLPALAHLRELLTTLSSSLSRRCWATLWPKLAARLDEYFFEQVISSKRVSVRCGRQLPHDLRVLYQLFRPFTRRPDNYFKLSKEACIILALPTAQLSSLARGLSDLPSSSTAQDPAWEHGRAMLETHHIFKLLPDVGLRVCRQRGDLRL